MSVSVIRKNVKFLPDSGRVIARYFMNGRERSVALVNRVQRMEEQQVALTLEQTLREFGSRHRNISQVFIKHCNYLRNTIEEMGIRFSDLSEDRKMLIGSYSTMEYSIESAAFFNPSLLADADQSYLGHGEKRVIISFRATGEGHISSLVFRRGILSATNDLQLMPVGDYIEMAEITHKKRYHKGRFEKKLAEMQIAEKYSTSIMGDLPDLFDYHQLKTAMNRLLLTDSISADRRMALEEMTWLADSFYDVGFTRDSDLSERVIFPVSDSESRGIEDARFVRFTDDDGSQKNFATYTAYNGHTILPMLLSTEDFYRFRIMPLHGNGAKNKNLALFPQRIKGKYAMLARVDGVNNYLMYSERNTVWNNPKIIQEPKFPWEFTQVGNCGSPIWTSEGWLILTHGVGPMRRYCIGASLFDLDDPSKEIGRLTEPLLAPKENERDGYVPNVVYSCGSLVHNNSLILPFAVSDYSSSYAVVDMSELLYALQH